MTRRVYYWNEITNASTVEAPWSDLPDGWTCEDSGGPSIRWVGKCIRIYQNAMFQFRVLNIRCLRARHPLILLARLVQFI